MREHLDFHGHMDGYVITYRGVVISDPIATWTGVARAMSAAANALAELERRFAMEDA